MLSSSSMRGIRTRAPFTAPSGTPHGPARRSKTVTASSASSQHMEMREVLEHLIARKDLTDLQAEQTLKARMA